MTRMLFRFAAWPSVFIDNYIAMRKVFTIKASIKEAYYLTNKYLFMKEKKNENHIDRS